MDSQMPQPDADDDPTNAFEALRGEVSLLRRAVEGLAAERQNAPDYTATLDATASQLGEIRAFMGAVAQSTAMRLTPETLAVSIAKASEAARKGDRDNLDRASASLQTSIKSIDGVVERAWTAERQNRGLLGAGLAGVIAGIILWSVLPGEVARALPTSWNVPEKMAARLMRMDMSDAGERLIAVARSRTAANGQPAPLTAPTSPVPPSPRPRHP